MNQDYVDSLGDNPHPPHGDFDVDSSALLSDTAAIGNPSTLVFCEAIKKGMADFGEKQAHVLKECFQSMLETFSPSGTASGTTRPGAGTISSATFPAPSGSKATVARTFSRVASDGFSSPPPLTKRCKLLLRSDGARTPVSGVAQVLSAGAPTTSADINDGNNDNNTNNNRREEEQQGDDVLSLLGSDHEGFDQSGEGDGDNIPQDARNQGSTLDRATVDFVIEDLHGPPVSLEIAFKVNMMIKTALPPERLKARVDRELCPSNVDILAKKVNTPLFNQRGGAMGNVRNTDLELQHIQKMINIYLFIDSITIVT